MSVVARRFSAAPVRTAAATWGAIVNMLAPEAGTIRSELMKIEGMVASIISEGIPQKNAITIIGNGPRLRIYCLYDEDGSTEDANESNLHWSLFEGDWEIYLPVAPSDVEWVKKALSTKGTQFQAYEVGTKIQAEEEQENSTKSLGNDLSINVSKL